MFQGCDSSRGKGKIAKARSPCQDPSLAAQSPECWLRGLWGPRDGSYRIKCGPPTEFRMSSHFCSAQPVSQHSVTPCHSPRTLALSTATAQRPPLPSSPDAVNRNRGQLSLHLPLILNQSPGLPFRRSMPTQALGHRDPAKLSRTLWGPAWASLVAQTVKNLPAL